MHDTTIKKVEAGSSPRGEMGQKYLVAGKRVSMRLWKDEPGGKLKGPTTRDYETVGYVISGSAKLDLEGQTLTLKAGDSWLVPAGATHQYTITEPFTAIEATSPPAEVDGRDAALSFEHAGSKWLRGLVLRSRPLAKTFQLVPSRQAPKMSRLVQKCRCPSATTASLLNHKAITRRSHAFHPYNAIGPCEFSG